MKKTCPYQDDSDITEITIQPDGRIYAFGLSLAVADVLSTIARPALPQAQTQITASAQTLPAGVTTHDAS